MYKIELIKNNREYSGMAETHEEAYDKALDNYLKEIYNSNTQKILLNNNFPAQKK
jgi:hypothetical protein